jgi:hypothetical protein
VKLVFKKTVAAHNGTMTDFKRFGIFRARVFRILKLLPNAD